MTILGINAYHGDVAAALLRDGELVAAVEEERFRRVKHWAGFPRDAIQVCLRLADVAPVELEHVAVSRSPRSYFWRKAVFALRNRLRFTHIVDRLTNLKRVTDTGATLAEVLCLDPEKVRSRVHWVEHHPAHLASAFYASRFDKAAVCAIDGFGDFVSTSWAVGQGQRLEIFRRVHFPHSLGIVYLAITQYLGFRKYGDEYKVMGLAPYGEPRYVPEIRRLVHQLEGGGFKLDLRYFRHHTEGVSMTWDDGEPTMDTVYTPELELLLGPARQPTESIEPRHEAIAASLQVVYEELAFHILNGLYQKTRLPQLCLAGGCAMNSVANGKIRERTPFREIFIQPAAGDNGTALGAALYVAHNVLNQPRTFAMEHAYWGPAFNDQDIAKAVAEKGEALRDLGCRVTRLDDRDELCRWTARQLAQGKIVGWFQGRMEWGARALGNRSILADPRRADMRDILNTRIKFREKFRPFAPSITEEALDDYFVGAVPDPFMVQVYPIRSDKRTVIPAVTHTDGSGRLQTVNRRTNSLYWDLLKAFERETGVPVLLNTSFNENEPIVHQPREALECFLRTGMDVLVMGHYVVDKSTKQVEESQWA